MQNKITIKCQEISDLLVAKNKNYGSSAFISPILAPDISASEAIQVRMSDKINRLANLLSGGKDLVGELITDTMKDLVGYGIIWLINDDIINNKTVKYTNETP